MAGNFLLLLWNGERAISSASGGSGDGGLVLNLELLTAFSETTRTWNKYESNAMQNFRLAQDARLAHEYRDQLDAQQERLLAVDKLEAELARARKYCQDLDLCRIKYEVLLSWGSYAALMRFDRACTRTLRVRVRV